MAKPKENNQSLDAVKNIASITGNVLYGMARKAYIVITNAGISLTETTINTTLELTGEEAEPKASDDVNRTALQHKVVYDTANLMRKHLLPSSIVERDSYVEYMGKKIKVKKESEKGYLSYYNKLIELLNRAYKMIKKGAFYLLILSLTIAFIFLIMIIASGKKIDQFLKIVSDMFQTIFDFMKRLFTGVLAGAIQFSPQKIKEAITKAYSKFNQEFTKIKQDFSNTGLDKAFIFVSFFTIISFGSLYWYISSSIKSNGGNKNEKQT